MITISEDELSRVFIGCAIEVHKQSGPGFFETCISGMFVL